MRVCSLVLPLIAAACGDLELKTVKPPDAVPAGLEGEWEGSWHSVQSNTGGSLNVQVQEFESTPVVGVRIDNPCVTPREYQLVLTPSTIELRADGATVFAAALEAGGTLLGTYQCDSDLGSWMATWKRALPPIIDLTGHWEGTLSIAGQPELPIRLHTQQNVVSGQIVVEGALELTGLLPTPIGMVGSAQFREHGFDLLLRTADGVTPELLLTTFGDREPLRMEIGLLQVFGAQLPFQQGLVEFTWQGP